MTPIPRVCLVASLPPPCGGIARWTQIITRHARTTGEADLRLVDIAPRWREIHDLRRWRRWVLGSAYGLILLGQVAWHLARGCQVLHITTSGQLAIHRDLAMMCLARAFGVPVLYHLRFGRVPELAGSRDPEWRLLVKALRLATTVIPIDQRTEATLRVHVPGLDLRLIPNCADLASLPVPSTRPGTPLTVLYLGWVIPAKGIEELLQAWGLLEAPGWRLVIAGPAEPSYLQTLVARHPMEGVEFTGELDHGASMAFMAQADIFVLPSHTEGFPNVIAEAMALARPIVATSVGAIPEMLQSGCGLTVPPRDVDSLRSALQALTSDAELRRRIAGAALERSKRFYTVPAVFDRLLTLWREKKA